MSDKDTKTQDAEQIIDQAAEGLDDIAEHEDNDELQAAFEAGYEGKDYEIEEAGDSPDEDGLEDISPEDDTGGVSDDVTDDDGQGEIAEADEWEGVPDAIKKQFIKMQERIAEQDGLLKQTQDIAKSASSRASKTQLIIDKQEDKSRLTKEIIRQTLTDSEKRNALREDWPEFAGALDEVQAMLIDSVGDVIDQRVNELASNSQQVISDYDIKQKLDTRHPDWENDVQTDEFKTWLYEGGPSQAEFQNAENRFEWVAKYSQSNPDDASTIEALAHEAEAFYNGLMAKYPEWGDTKGKLYVSPNMSDGLSLMDNYSKFKEQSKIVKQETDNKHTTDNSKQVTAKKQRLADNVSPTTGAGRKTQVALDIDDDPEAAFEAGFYGDRKR